MGVYFILRVMLSMGRFSDNSIYSSDSRNVPMMFDPHGNKFKTMADNDSGNIILKHQPPDIDTNSLGTGTFYGLLPSTLILMITEVDT